MKTTQVLYNKMREAVMQDPAQIFWPLQMMLKEIEPYWQTRLHWHEMIIQIIQAHTQEPKAAQAINQLLGQKHESINRQLETRAHLVWSQIREHVRGNTLLDFGCGDGRVSALAKGSGHNVYLYDIADYRTSGLDLPFTQQWSQANTDFDTALALVVFHHSDEPEREIARLRTACNRLIVIESVIDNRVMPWASQGLIDWVYNRGLHPKARIPVPGNFKTANEWLTIFIRHGFKPVKEQDLGIDLPVVPEHHHLFILE